MKNPDLSDDKVTWRLAFEVVDAALMSAKSHQNQDLAVVVATMLRRLQTSLKTLVLLVETADHDFGHDASMIIRGIYDVMIQGLYVMNDVDAMDERARLFADFIWVERHLHIRLFDRSDTAMAGRMRLHEKRLTSGRHVEREYRRVRGAYTTKGGRSERATWYKGSLRDLAKEVGYESEYEILQKQLSGAVHSSPLALESGSMIAKYDAATFAIWFAVRFAGAVTKAFGVTVEPKLQQMILWSRENVFDSRHGG